MYALVNVFMATAATSIKSATSSITHSLIMKYCRDGIGKNRCYIKCVPNDASKSLLYMCDVDVVISLYVHKNTSA